MNNQSKNSNMSDELLYEFVMDEMEQESKPIKGLWAKALAHSDGNDSKAKSLYMQYRVQSIKDQLSALQIDLGDLSKEELFESIKNGFTVIPEKIQMIKEQKAEAEEKAMEISIEEKVKKEHEKYGKFGGWLIVLALFIVTGVLLGFLRVEHFFENENLDALNLLYQSGMDGKASLLNAIAYINFISYGLLLAFTLSFFRKDILTKNFAIIYFGFNIVAFPIIIYLLIKINLPTMNVMTAVIGGAMQTLFALIWIVYFIVSERVEKTFVNGTDENDTSIVITLLISLGAIALASVLYANQSVKNTLITGQAIVPAVQTTSEVVDAAAPAFLPGEQESKVESKLITFKKSCDDGDAEGCYHLGKMYDANALYVDRTGVKEDDKQAEKYYKKACDGGNIYGCYHLGKLYDAYYSGSKGVKKDDKEAKKYYKKACDGGDDEACDSYEHFDEMLYGRSKTL